MKLRKSVNFEEVGFELSFQGRKGEEKKQRAFYTGGMMNKKLKLLKKKRTIFNFTERSLRLRNINIGKVLYLHA